MSKTSLWPYLFVAICTAILLALKLDYLPLIFEEPRRAIVSLEMILSGNYVVPKINGFEYYNKPPVYNWLLMVLFKLFGLSEWVVRLPTYLSLFGIAGLNYIFFSKRIGTVVAMTSSFFFLLSGHVLFYFSFMGEIDITYSLIVFSQIVTILHYKEKQSFWSLFGWSYLLMVVGFLTKGVPSILFQGLTIIGLAIYYRKWVYLFHPANFLFLFASLLAIYGYFSWYSGYSDPIPYLARLINESSRRASPDFIELLVNPFRVLLEFVKITFPWCLMAIPLIWKRNRNAESNRWIRMMLLFLIVNTWVYLISPGTRDRYLYMFLPFIYNVVVFYLIPLLKNNDTFYRKGVVVFAALIGIVFYAISIKLNSNLIWPISLSLALSMIIWLILKHQITVIIGFFAIMLLARLSYDFIVFPIRKIELKTQTAKTIVPKILSLTGELPIGFYTSISAKEASLPFVGTIDIPQIERLPFDLSFYVSRTNKSPIAASNILTDGQWYISLKEKIPTDQSVSYQFELENKSWVLFKK